MIQAGVVAELSSVEALLEAVHRLRALGYTLLDAYTPHPVKGLEEALGWRRSRLDLAAGAAGAFGAAFAFLLQAYLVGYLYPLNVGGRPPVSIAPFIVITFETMVLFAAVTAFLALFWVCRLPRLRHPLFAVDGFASVTLDRYWVGISAADERFDPDATEAHLRALGPARIEYVGDQP
jgi:hypothetical protein